MNIRKFNNYFFIYLFLLFLFGIFWLYIKHSVGNDSTISEWFINYQGGFTKRGLIGEICIQIAKYFDLSLRFVIFLFQSFIYTIFLILIYIFFRNTPIPKNLIIILSIFTPIFLLYPIAEIEVLARKETFIFIGFILFLNISNSNYSSNLPLCYVFFILPFLCLIWEPVIFFFPFMAAVLIIRLENNQVKTLLRKIIICFIPALVISAIIATNPITKENHNIMANSIELENFGAGPARSGERCYMSCNMLQTRSSIISQFTKNFESYSLHPEVFLRYPLIILFGFAPIFLLSFNTKLRIKVFFFERFKNLFYPILLILTPILVLFSMMGDWGRIVNISYTFTVLFYFYLLKNNLLRINFKNITKKITFVQNKKSLLVLCFIIYAFGWNPKTVLTGDVASFPGYRIPYKTMKVLYYKIINN
jgi:hypothetical protein